MEVERYTCTGSSEASVTAVHFSGSAPDFMVTTRGASHIELQQDKAGLEQRIGELTIELSQASQQIAELEAALAEQGGDDPSSSSQEDQTVLSDVGVRSEPLKTVENLEKRVTNSLLKVPAQDQSEKETSDLQKNAHEAVSSLQEVTDVYSVSESVESLSPAHARYERAILFLLDQPDQRIETPNAGGWLRERLGIERKDWSNLLNTLSKYTQIITLHKTSPDSRRSYAVSLDIAEVLHNSTKPFVTQRVIERIKQGMDQPIQGEVDRAAVSTNGHGNGNGDKQLHDGDEVKIVRSGTNPHLSKRVSKAMEKDPQPVSGYRRLPEDHSFLAHRRERPGAKR